MVTCEHCGAKLPDWATQCQFCNAVITPTTVSQSLGKIGQAAEWVWAAYYTISVLYIIQGCADLGIALWPLTAGKSVGLGSVISIVLGAVTALFGIGLLCRVELIRGIANVLCAIQIVLGLAGLIGGTMGALFFGPLGLLVMLLNVLRIAEAAFMIYLIGETDRAAPNL